MSAKKKRHHVATSSRVEMPHFCWIVGRSDDPREVAEFAINLGCSETEAIGYLVRWDEMVFRKADPRGRLPGVRAKDIATYLKWRGNQKQLIAAMKEAGILALTKHQVFVHPTWSSSRTGEYLQGKEEQRIYWKEWKRERRRRAAEAEKLAAQMAAAAAAGGGLGDHPEIMSKDVHMDINGLHVESNGIHVESTGVHTLSKKVSKDIRTGPAPSPPLKGGGRAPKDGDGWRETTLST